MMKKVRTFSDLRTKSCAERKNILGNYMLGSSYAIRGDHRFSDALSAHGIQGARHICTRICPHNCLYDLMQLCRKAMFPMQIIQ
ncbi:hypothetical protein EUGRSUZ_G02821 [Eucalyptus grandis]|uniref:Uncharacterized protein n=2 Tax=Eucalyptus grandis TaxID=71139 RepID=A0ACC3K7P7_EUCGR|nr:hypothetical protein EUGRSUZ_G02821 [Eucalyptus grandis]